MATFPNAARSHDNRPSKPPEQVPEVLASVGGIIRYQTISVSAAVGNINAFLIRDAALLESASFSKPKIAEYRRPTTCAIAKTQIDTRIAERPGDRMAEPAAIVFFNE